MSAIPGPTVDAIDEVDLEAPAETSNQTRGGPSTETAPPEIFQSDQLTEELIDCIEDVAKLRSLFVKFHKKSSWNEKEHEKFKAEQGRKLQDAESRNEVFKEELYKKIYEALEQDLNCSICSELFIQPAVLECGHTFCAHCIGQWKNGGNRACPICRQYIFRPITKHVGLGNFLTKFHSMLSQEIRSHRDQLILERGQQVQQTQSSSNSVLIPHGSSMRLLSSAGSQPRDRVYTLMTSGASFVPPVPPQPRSLVPNRSAGTTAANPSPSSNEVSNQTVANLLGLNALINPNAQPRARNPSNGAVLERLRARIHAYRNRPAAGPASSSSAPATGTVSTATTAPPTPANTPGTEELHPSVPPTSLTSSPFYQSLVAEIETLRHSLSSQAQRPERQSTNTSYPRLRFDEGQEQNSNNEVGGFGADTNRRPFQLPRYNVLLDSPDFPSTGGVTSVPVNRYSRRQGQDTLELDGDGPVRSLSRIARDSHAISRAVQNPRPSSSRQGATLPPPSSRPPNYTFDNSRRNEASERNTEAGVRVEYVPDPINSQTYSRSRSAQIQGAMDYLNFDPLEMADLEFMENSTLENDEGDDDMLIL